MEMIYSLLVDKPKGNKRAAMPTHKPTPFAAHLILPNRTQSTPSTLQVDIGKLECNF